MICFWNGRFCFHCRVRSNQRPWKLVLTAFLFISVHCSGIKASVWKKAGKPVSYMLGKDADHRTGFLQLWVKGQVIGRRDAHMQRAVALKWQRASENEAVYVMNHRDCFSVLSLQHKRSKCRSHPYWLNAVNQVKSVHLAQLKIKKTQQATHNFSIKWRRSAKDQK